MVSYDKNKVIKHNKYWILFWSVFFGVVAVLLVVSMSSEHKTVSGSNPENYEIESLSCESETVSFPFLKYDESDRKQLKIVVAFDADGIRSISLQQMLYYSESEKIELSASENHAAMNIAFNDDGLSADALGANYAKLTDGLRIGLFAKSDELNKSVYKYFMLDGLSDMGREDIKKAYENIGLRCN